MFLGHAESFCRVGTKAFRAMYVIAFSAFRMSISVVLPELPVVVRSACALSYIILLKPAVGQLACKCCGNRLPVFGEASTLWNHVCLPRPNPQHPGPPSKVPSTSKTAPFTWHDSLPVSLHNIPQ